MCDDLALKAFEGLVGKPSKVGSATGEIVTVKAVHRDEHSRIVAKTMQAGGNTLEVPVIDLFVA